MFKITVMRNFLFKGTILLKGQILDLNKYRIEDIVYLLANLVIFFQKKENKEWIKSNFAEYKIYLEKLKNPIKEIKEQSSNFKKSKQLEEKKEIDKNKKD